ncbi:CvpA family protein [Paenirhodobacter sp.]|uniref:CvpA family protein n=1 Tax=Paenirhodobacter sp. TaxID=1965326 RepID=UPI003B3D3A9A
MEGFTIVDAIVAVVIILSAILAYSRGFVREGLAIVGWIAAAVVAFLFAPAARPMIAQLPFLNKFLGDSCELATIGAFAAVFALALVVFSVITPLFATVIQRSALGGLDQGLGFLFGVVRGVVLIAVAFVLYDRVGGANSVPMIDQSRSASIFAGLSDKLEQQVPTDAPGWVVARYEQLVANCPAPTTTTVE